MVDELGGLEQELAPFAGKIKRVDYLRKSLRDRFDQAPAEHPQTAEGAKFVVLLGMKGEQQKVSIPKLVKAVGLKKAIAICSCTLEAVKTLGKEVFDACVSKARTGHRSIEIQMKGATS